MLHNRRFIFEPKSNRTELIECNIDPYFSDPDTDSLLSLYPLSLYIGLLYTLFQRHQIELLQAGPSRVSTETVMSGLHEAAIATRAQLVLLN